MIKTYFLNVIWNKSLLTDSFTEISPICYIYNWQRDHQWLFSILQWQYTLISFKRVLLTMRIRNIFRLTRFLTGHHSKNFSKPPLRGLTPHVLSIPFSSNRKEVSAPIFQARLSFCGTWASFVKAPILLYKRALLAFSLLSIQEDIL